MRPFVITLAVLAMLAPSAWFFWQARDAPHLGTFEDDSLYLVAGKSLAEGKGYRILSLPGEPYQTKYPPLYPLILAAVWKLDGNFPANMSKVMLVQWVLWLAFLATAALMLWSLKPLSTASKWASLVFIAVSPPFVYLGLSVMPETLFATLCMTSILLANVSSWTETRRALLSGACAACAVLTKVAGIPLIVAGFLYWLLKKNYKRAALFVAPACLAIAGWAYWCFMHRLKVNDINLIYYTDYINYYFGTTTLADLLKVFTGNISALAESAGLLAVFYLVRDPFSLFLHILIGVVVLAIGLCFIAKIRPNFIIIFVFLFLLQNIIWNFRPDVRFIFPVLLFLSAGFFWGLEVTNKRLFSKELRVYVYSLVTISLIAWNLLQTTAYLRSFIPESRRIWNRLKCASDWISEYTSPSDDFITYRDVDLFLLSGRHGLRPVREPIPYYYENTAALEKPLRNIAQYAATSWFEFLLWDKSDFLDDSYLGDPERKEKILAEIKDIVLERELCGVRIYRFTRSNSSPD